MCLKKILTIAMSGTLLFWSTEKKEIDFILQKLTKPFPKSSAIHFIPNNNSLISYTCFSCDENLVQLTVNPATKPFNETKPLFSPLQPINKIAHIMCGEFKNDIK